MQTAMTRIGGWLFRRRTVIPLPLALAVLLAPERLARAPAAVVAAGVVLVVTGELIRLWGVRHIGVISRTRSDRLGPLVASGPFALVRNPLYVGNIALWVGFALSARLLWLAPVVRRHPRVRISRHRPMGGTAARERLGERYRAYAAQVPRWIPNTFNRRDRRARGDLDFSAGSAASAVNVFSWRETFYSERGTLIAIAVGYVLLWLKAQL